MNLIEVRAPGTELANDQWRPPLREHLRGDCHRTELAIAFHAASLKRPRSAHKSSSCTDIRSHNGRPGSCHRERGVALIKRGLLRLGASRDATLEFTRKFAAELFRRSLLSFF